MAYDAGFAKKTGEIIDEVYMDMIRADEAAVRAWHTRIDRGLLFGSPWEGTGLWWDMRLKVAIDGIGA